MSRFRYTEKHLAFLREQYQVMMIEDLTKSFNKEFGLKKTRSQISSVLKANKISCGRGPGAMKGTLRSFTREQADWIREQYKTLSLTDLVKAFNDHFNETKTYRQIKSFTKNHSIKSGRTGRFDKGELPWNTGTKGICKPNSGSFKKGVIPGNTRPLGSERICSKDGYILVKVAETNPHTGAPTRYRHKHQVIWEAEHGPIPKGHVVVFIDNNKMNCDIDNLMLLTRQQLAYINCNGYASLPGEIKTTIAGLAKLVAKQRELEKEQAA